MSLKGIGAYFWSIIIIMLGIFIVKWAARKWNVPVLSDIAAV